MSQFFLCIRSPKYCSFSFNISPSNEYSGLLSFRIDCPGDFQESSPAPQFKSIHSSVLSLLHGPSIHNDWKKTIALTIRTFVGKVMSLLFNTLSRFLPKSKHLLISWLKSLSTVILEPEKRKSVTASTFSHLFAMK